MAEPDRLDQLNPNDLIFAESFPFHAEFSMVFLPEHSMGGRFADLVEERPLIVAVQPREVQVEDARLPDQPELPDGDPHRFHRGVAGIGLDRVEW